MLWPEYILIIQLVTEFSVGKFCVATSFQNQFFSFYICFTRNCVPGNLSVHFYLLTLFCVHGLLSLGGGSVFRCSSILLSNVFLKL